MQVLEVLVDSYSNNKFEALRILQ